MSSQPIAVFDSGLGGLSVVRHLRDVLPHESIVYFGDTARVPYGSKSRRTVATFSLEAARFLLQFEPKLIVAACNTASALAIDELERGLPRPVIGVVKPGARAAVERAFGAPIAILGTEATINSGAYPDAIRALGVETDVIQQACPLFVPLVEEGRPADDPIVRLTVETYLAPVHQRLTKARRPASGPTGVLVLGCTHYPLLADAIAAYLGSEVRIVDSGRETSLAVKAALEQAASLSRPPLSGTLRCYVSDNPARFRQVGSRFLRHEIEHVEFVEPERYIS